MIKRARELRNNATDAESYLWQFLRNRLLNGYKFRRQHVLDSYILDFVCETKKLIIELDGEQHLETKTYDEKRTLSLNNNGYKVLRFWNNIVFTEIDGVLETILDTLESE